MSGRLPIKPTDEEKLNVVIKYNTFYQKKDPQIEREYQNIIINIIRCLRKLKRKIEKLDASEFVNQQLETVLATFLQQEDYGVESLLTLIGLSDEKFYRIISFLRIAYQSGLFHSQSKWVKETFEEGSLEWKMDEIKRRLKKDYEFAKDITLILLGKNKLINKFLTEFDAKKLDHRKFLNIPDENTLDTLARYSLFGSYNAKKGKGAEQIVEEVLNNAGIPYEQGKIEGVRATMDFIIPSKQNPKIFVQVSYQGTTSSAMGRKARDESGVAEDIKRNYPDAIFIQFIDGIGWIIRISDLKTMVKAGDYVFTFDDEQLKKFEKLLLDYKPSLQRFSLQHFLQHRQG